MKQPNNQGIQLLKPAFLFVMLILPLQFFAQQKIDIVNANSLKSANNIANGAKRLIGNVQFRQDDVLMFCDSAYFYSNNSLDAFGHVHIQQGDSLHLKGELLKYDGNTKKAVITKNVVVNKGDMQLSTETLNYDVANRVGYYLNPAKIVNNENTLTSKQGYYFSANNELQFKKDVVLVNPQFIINCDTMRYNTETKITYFLGPTTIKSKENLIYCEDGWYDTKKDFSRFSKNAYILTDQQKMYGDSLYYDRNLGLGRAVRNISIIDTLQNLTINGELALYYEFQDLSIVTGNALLSQYYKNDTLFLHADTLKAQGETKQKKLVRPDSLMLPVDSTQKTARGQKLFAYHHVKFLKSDLQGKCDSVLYIISDSVMKLFGTPTLWSEENQLTADSIKVHTGGESLRSIELFGSGFLASKEDSLRYNQIRGKYMKGFFHDNHLYRLNIEGNGQTIYYAKEKEKMKAVNRTDCSDLNIFFIDNKINRITFLTKPVSTLYPLDRIDVKELRLKDFSWREKDRPRTYKDIFNW